MDTQPSATVLLVVLVVLLLTLSLFRDSKHGPFTPALAQIPAVAPGWDRGLPYKLSLNVSMRVVTSTDRVNRLVLVSVTAS